MSLHGTGVPFHLIYDIKKTSCEHGKANSGEDTLKKSNTEKQPLMTWTFQA